MKRWVLIGITSLASFVLAMFPAAHLAAWVEQAWYPNDPDPVDFRIGGIFLIAWFLLWLIFTVAMVSVAKRSSRVRNL